MANNDPQTNYVYKARLIAHSYVSNSFQFEEIELGTFSKETFAIDAVILEIKEGVYKLYESLVEELQDIKEEKWSLTEDGRQRIKGIEEVVKFLKETYNGGFHENLHIQSINQLIENISTKLRDVEDFNFFEYIVNNDNSYFHPFFSMFYCNQSSDSEESTFTFEINEVVVDKISSRKELPSTIE